MIKKYSSRLIETLVYFTVKIFANVYLTVTRLITFLTLIIECAKVYEQLFKEYLSCNAIAFLKKLSVKVLPFDFKKRLGGGFYA